MSSNLLLTRVWITLDLLDGFDDIYQAVSDTLHIGAASLMVTCIEIRVTTTAGCQGAFDNHTGSIEANAS